MFWNKTANLKNAMFVILAILLIVFIIQIKSIALLAFGSFVLACSLNPAVDKLSKKMPRSLASTIVITGTILITVLFFIPIVTISIEEIHQFIDNLPVFVRNAADFMSSKTIMGKTLIEYVNIDAITQNSSQMATGILNKSINFTMALMEMITIVITIGVIVFYMINERNLIRDAIILVFPPKLKEKAKEVYESIENKVGGYVIALILSMSTVAVFTAVGLMLLKVQYAILLGLIAGLLDIVPIVGPTLAFILGILCASQQGWLVVILTAVVYLAAQWVSNNFVRPLVFGKFLDLHPIIIIFAFLIAAQFLGVWGVILSPAIAALLLTLFDELYLKTINKAEKCDKTEKKEEA
ncbi:MAG: AI-2E family transporter [Candidatus Gastranaerophilales bacterium]|nr:AI-2E family transporter [Candidatus Gastranaerophilales bacterium]